MVLLSISVKINIGFCLGKFSVLHHIYFGGRVKEGVSQELHMGRLRCMCRRLKPSQADPGWAHASEQKQTWACLWSLWLHAKQVHIKGSWTMEADYRQDLGKGPFCKLSAPGLVYLEDESYLSGPLWGLSKNSVSFVLNTYYFPLSFILSQSRNYQFEFAEQF